MDGVRIAKLFSSACILLLAANLCFRGFLYPRLYIAPGAPYGISDLIELLLGCSLILVLTASVGLAAFLGIKGPRANRLVALWLGKECRAGRRGAWKNMHKHLKQGNETSGQRSQSAQHVVPGARAETKIQEKTCPKHHEANALEIAHRAW